MLLTHLVEIFEGGPCHGRSAWFYGNRTVASLEVTSDHGKGDLMTGLVGFHLSEGWQSISIRSTSGSSTQSQNLP